MGTTSDKLSYLATTKDKLKTAINYTGANITNDTFRSYAEKLYNAYINIINQGTQELFDSLPKVQSTGTSITLNNTKEAPILLELKGNTSQNGTPTPDSPVDINVVSGDNTIEICGKNLFDKSKAISNYRITQDGTPYSDNNYYISPYIKVIPNTQYTKNSPTADGYHRYAFYQETNTSSFISVSSDNTITTPNNCNYIRFCGAKTEKDTAMVELGNSSSEYEAYTGNSQLISLGVENLFDKDSVTTGYLTYLNGVDTASNWRITDYIKISPNTPYIMSGCVNGTGSNPSRCYYDINKTFISGVKHETSSTSFVDTSPNNAYYMRESIREDDLNTAMIEKGSKANSYTPFGTTPIILGSINDNENEFIRTSGRQLYKPLSFSRTNNGITFTHNLDGTITANGTSTANAFSMNSTQAVSNNCVINLKAGTYTLSGGENDVYVNLVDLTGSNVSTTDGTNFSKTFTINEDTQCFIRMQVPNGKTISNKTIYPMLEIGSSVTDYNPYGSDEWYLKKAINRVVLDGSEDWLKGGGSSSTYGRYYIQNFASVIDLGLSNNFLLGLYTNRNNQTENNKFFIGENSLQFRKDDITTANDFKNWLSTHNTIVDYVLETPTYTKIEGTLKDQLEEIYKAKSQNGTTNIMQENNDMPFKITASAIKEYE